MSRWLRSLALTLLLAAAVAGGLGLLLRRWTPARVAGGSMQPALHAGDVVVVDRARRPSRGQIALVQTERHGRYLHRVVELRPDGSIVTQGDANPVADFDPLPSQSIVGPVVAVMPVGRWLGR